MNPDIKDPVEVHKIRQEPGKIWDMAWVCKQTAESCESTAVFEDVRFFKVFGWIIKIMCGKIN